MKQRLQREPFRGPAVQRREAGDRDRTDEKGAAGERHALEQTADVVELERSQLTFDGTCAEEKQ
jgi:hypothetical protein